MCFKPFGSKEVLNSHQSGGNAFALEVYTVIAQRVRLENSFSSLEVFVEFHEACLKNSKFLQS